MLQALLVTFREGLESFLIVAVVAGYLRRTGRARLLRGVRAGVALSVVTCAAGAWLWIQVPNQPLCEGIAALGAAGLVGALLVQMARAGRRLRGDIEARIERAAGPDARGAGRASLRSLVGVALATALLITREGMEAVVYLRVQWFYAGQLDLGVGALCGVALAAVVAVAWVRHSARLDLGAVLRVTAVFLGLFLVQLCVYGVHELAESGVVRGSQAFHDATEKFGPDGAIGHFMSYSLVLAPLVYLVLVRRGRAQLPAPVIATPSAPR